MRLQGPRGRTCSAMGSSPWPRLEYAIALREIAGQSHLRWSAKRPKLAWGWSSADIAPKEVQTAPDASFKALPA